MRGKVFLPQTLRRWSGITPAYAGKRWAGGDKRRKVRDHPRVCGEKIDMSRSRFDRSGSPPRMRGKDGAVHRDRPAGGITPAYAGKSKRRLGTMFWCGDHPRVCGEKAAGCQLGGCRLGSPPRMRGKGGCPSAWRMPVGITPAYAGKRTSRQGKHHQSRDHPRVCGEKSMSAQFSGPQPGSPPRMRGKACHNAVILSAPGITPAYAGKRKSSYNV